MSRHTGPRVKVMRASGVELPGFARKEIERQTRQRSCRSSDPFNPFGELGIQEDARPRCAGPHDWLAVHASLGGWTSCLEWHGQGHHWI
jgi:hypothetical protein